MSTGDSRLEDRQHWEQQLAPDFGKQWSEEEQWGDGRAIDVGDVGVDDRGDPASPDPGPIVQVSRFGLSIVLSFLLLDSHVVGRLRYHVGRP